MFIAVRMKPTLRIVSFIIAMLIAGRETMAFGSALSAKFDACWSEEGNPINDNWLLECEGAEECDDQEDECNEETAAKLNCFGQTKRHLLNFSLTSCTSKFDFLIRVPEFYIYVLNLRL